MTALSPAQIRRYSRHVLLPDVGGLGQRRLLASAAAIEIDGAAKRVAAAYLAAAGVGRLWLEDRGQLVTAAAARFPLGPADVGHPLASSLRAALAARNGEVDLVVGAAPREIARLEIEDDADDLDLASAFARGGAAAASWLHRVATGAAP